jgi:hypothetical protein
MSIERNLRRYSAYFRGWGQAFGEHDIYQGGESEISWLVTQDHVGFILSDTLKRSIFREMLGHPEAIPTLNFSRSCVELGGFRYDFTERDQFGMAELVTLLSDSPEAHLYLSYHLLYPRGTRIVTISRKRPLGLIYRELSPARLVINSA